MDQQFRAALGALYGSDPALQQSANLWLHDFAKSPDAWGCGLALLDPGSGATLEQAFFAANMLASKTRSEWGRLSPQQRTELVEAYMGKLRGMLLTGPPSSAAAVPAVLLDRLVLLAASAAALAGWEAAERLLAAAQDAAAAGRAALAAGERAGGEALLRCSLLVLQLLAEEADGLDRVRRQPLVAGAGTGAGADAPHQPGTTGLAGRRGSVIGLARDVLALASGSADSGFAVGGPSWALLVGSVRCLGAWVRLEESGAGGCGVSPAELEALSPGLLPSLLHLLSLPPPGAAPPLSPSGAAAQSSAAQGDGGGGATEPLHQALADLAAELLGPSGRTCTAAAGGEAADAAATAAAVQVLVPLGHQLAAAAGSAGGAAGAAATAAVSALAAAVAVAVAVAERNPCGLATGPGEGAVELARMVVAAMAACPRRREVTEPAIDFLLALNTVPTSERHASLGAPLYGALLPYVLAAVSYPSGFADWEEEVEEDEEAFHRFREQQVSELLDSMYGQCRTALVAQLVAEATGAGGAAADGGSAGVGVGGWQRAEAALFCLRAIHVPVKHAAMGSWSGQDTSPQAAAQAAELQGLLGRLFNDICSPGGRVAGLLSVPWVGLAAARLLGEYAAWLGKAPEAPLQGALALLLHLLAVPPAATAAAQAFRNCCVRGADKLTAHPPTLSALASAAMAAVAPPPPSPTAAGGGGAAEPLGLAGVLSVEERSGVVEGLSRLVATLPTEAAAEAGCALMAPLVARVQAVAAAAAAEGGRLSPAALAALASELGLMTAVVRFLEPPHQGQQGRWPGPGPAGAGHRNSPAAAAAAETSATAAAAEHPGLRVLQTAWPVLSAVAAEPQCRADAGVVAALAELYKRSLLSAKLAGRPLLPPLLTSLLGLLRSGTTPGSNGAAGSGGGTFHAAALDPLSTVVELFGEVAHSGEARRLQVAAFEAAAQMMASLMAHLQQQQASTAPFPSSSSPAELAAAFFALADRHLLFARELLLAGEGAALLPHLIEWACGVLTLMREREPASAALSFLSHLLGTAARVTAEAAASGGGAAGGAAAPAEQRARLDALFASAGPRLVHSLLVAGADTCPRQLLRPLAGCLVGLTALADAGVAAAAAPGGGAAGAVSGGGLGETAVRSGLQEWLRDAWGVAPLAELAQSGRLGEGATHAARFTELLLRGHYPHPAAGAAAAAPAPLSRGRLDSLVSDFFALCRGEAGEDVMLAYEL